MGIVHDCIVGPFFFPDNLNGVTYENFLRDELWTLLEDVPLAIRSRIEVIFNNTMAVCHRCWQRANNDVNQQDLPDENVVVDVNSPAEGAQPNEIFVPEYVRAPNSSRTCLYRHCRNLDLRRIPASIRLFAICNYSLYFPPSTRLCQEHLSNIIWDVLLDNVNVTNYFNAELVSDMTTMLIRGMNAHRLRFDSVTGLDAHEFHFWTGLTIEQFNSMLLETPSLAERHRHPRRVLGAYMTKLRTGESNERLATLFGMSRRTFEDHLKIARECLTQDFVNRHLGLDHVSRENVLERNLLIPKEFFGDEQNTKAILILDGTSLGKSGGFTGNNCYRREISTQCHCVYSYQCPCFATREHQMGLYEYHEEMNSEKFEELFSKLLEEPSIIIIDNAKYHSCQRKLKDLLQKQYHSFIYGEQNVEVSYNCLPARHW
ncbi:unnamed protein product [Colias eurytheme]|nr:unnamed protein product [Colias eurytheme]